MEQEPMHTRQPVVVGVDLGGTKVLAGVVGQDTTVLSRVKRRTATYRDQPAALLDLLAEVIRSAAEQAGQALDAIAAVGLGVPGSLDLDRSVVLVAPNLGWKNLPARVELQQRLGDCKDPLYLILDDSLANKDKGTRKLEPVDWFFDHKLNRPVQASNHVSLSISWGNYYYPLLTRLYLRACTVRKRNRSLASNRR